jgi:type III secretory pathway lipoprotein EscJ
MEGGSSYLVNRTEKQRLLATVKQELIRHGFAKEAEYGELVRAIVGIIESSIAAPTLPD